MALKILPDVKFPLTSNTVAPLMDNLVQLNLIEGCLTKPQQLALGIYFHVYDLWVKSNGKYDYRGRDGHERLKQDAKNYSRSDYVIHRHGDLAAAHLSIDFSDTQIRCKEFGAPPLPNDVSSLIAGCIDLCGLTDAEERRIGLLLDILSKKTPV